jgi:hypothetical protein
MPYVRDRIAPASKTHVRERREAYRTALAPDPANPGLRFDGAYDWFRAALAYAGRRSYRTLAIGDAASARRTAVTDGAASVLQSAGDEVMALIRPSFRPGAHHGEIRAAYGRATSPPARLNAAHAWLLFATRQAERYARSSSSGTGMQAAEIRDRAAARLIEWAEEMDADDYGE